MKYEFKGTQSPGSCWELCYSGGKCIGVTMPFENGVLHVPVCGSVSPDTDEEYEKEKEQIIADMTLIAAAPDLLQACLAAWEHINVSYPAGAEAVSNVKAAIEKALNIEP